MTTGNDRTEAFVHQQLGHVSVESSALYICTDAAAVIEYVESSEITVVDGTQPKVEGPDYEGEQTP